MKKGAETPGKDLPAILPPIQKDDAPDLKSLIDLRFTHLLRSSLEPKEMVAVLKEAMAWHSATDEGKWGSKLGRTYRDEG